MDEQSPDTMEAATPDGTPIVLTGKAIEMVRAAMQREHQGPEAALRIGVVTGGCSGFSYEMSFDREVKPEDTVVEIDGIRVVIDAPSRPYLEGTVLDYVTGLHGSGFKFENPKAQRTCGCGSSFSA